MAYTSLKRKWWYLYRCTSGIQRPEGFFGRTPIKCANEAVSEAWGALEQAHLGSGYVPTKGGYIGTKRNCPAGIGGRTCESSGKNCSLHNYCIAIDVEYNYNKLGGHYPQKHSSHDIFVRDKRLHKYTSDMIAAIEGVKNAEGVRIFRWLGWIGDYMHWEIDVAPEDLNVDWATVPKGSAPPVDNGEDNVFCKYGDGFGAGNSSDNVLYWQYILEELGADLGSDGKDGKYGSDTTNAVLGLIGGTGTEIGPKEAAELGALRVGDAGEHTHPLPSHSHTGTVEVE